MLWSEVTSPIMLSLQVACWATAINLILSVGFGFFLSRYKFWGNGLLDAVATLPMVLPPTVLGYYLLVLLGNRGTFGGWLQQTFDIQLVFTIQGAIIAATVAIFPLVFKPAKAAFDSINQQLEQAGQVLGVSNFAVFFRITLPLAWQGIMAGLLLGFVRALGEFGATLMIAGSIPGKTQTLSIAIYEAVQAGHDDVANTLVLLISAICVIFLLLANWLSKQQHRQ